MVLGCRDSRMGNGVLMGMTILLSCVGRAEFQTGCNTSRSAVIEELLNPAKYDKRIAPNFDTGNFTTVMIDIFINSFDSISEATMDLMLTLYLRQYWEDHRLDFDDCGEGRFSLDSEMATLLWTPDLFFPNEKSGEFHDLTKPNKLLYLYPNGSVYYSMRLSVNLACPMELEYFPMDTQTCALQVESFAYTTDRLRFEWREQGSYIQSASDLQLPQFSWTKTERADCTKNYQNTGNFTCMEVRFVLRRNVGFYLIQLYVPSGLIVILSWVSFFLDAEAVPARISLGVLTILTMITQSSGAINAAPKVSYVTALNVWTTVCLIFVFLALVEFAMLNALARVMRERYFAPVIVTDDNVRNSMREDRFRNHSEEGSINLRHRNTESKQPKDTPHLPSSPPGHKIAWPYHSVVARLDKISRVAFPVAFFLFNLCYWVTYSQQGKRT